jgi:pyruvate decarboxylase
MLAELSTTLPNKPNRIFAIPCLPNRVRQENYPEDRITQAWMWDEFSKHFLRPGDFMLAETGTCTFGISDTKFPTDVRYTTQTYYGSIGWAHAATLGVELARQDLENDGETARQRTIVVTGDGSFGLTMQEIGTMITAKTKPIIFLLNNEGYTIERVIHGARQPYNNINQLQYSHLLHLFDHPAPDDHFHRCTTPTELSDTFKKLSTTYPKALTVVEVILDKLDVPWRLSAQLALRGPHVVEELREAGFSGWTQEEKYPIEWVDAEEVLKLGKEERRPQQVNGNIVPDVGTKRGDLGVTG